MTYSIGIAIVAKAPSGDLRRCIDYSECQANEVVSVVNANLNLSEARNKAAGMLSTDVYAFVDADAYPGLGWVDELRKGYEDGALAVGGPAEPDGVYYTNFDLEQWNWLLGIGPFYDDVRDVRNTYGCNYSMRADVFDELGGFDESMGKGAEIPHGEETDLARRMYQEYGERMQYRPEAKVYHRVSAKDVRPTALLRRAYEQGYTKARIGVDGEESGFVKERIRNLSGLTELALLVSSGLGAIRGVMLRG